MNYAVDSAAAFEEDCSYGNPQQGICRIELVYTECHDPI